MKQTAVEWLMQQLPTIHKNDPYYQNLFTQAKEMEKEQIVEAYMRNLIGVKEPRWKEIFKKQAEQYYNKTFKSE